MSQSGFFGEHNAPSMVWFLGIRWHLERGFYYAHGMQSKIMSEMLRNLNSNQAFTQEGYEAYCAQNAPLRHSKFDN